MNQSMPPLRQSTYETMACPHSYSLVHIQGLKPPDTVASSRGTEVHAVLAAYVTHCAQRRAKADFMYLDSLMDSVGQETAEILTTCREGFSVDWENFFTAEATLALDVDFDPTYTIDHGTGEILPPAPMWMIDDPNPNPPAYSGTIDTIYLMPGGRVARIVDYKSHPRPFDPTTFQAKLYSLMLMMHMPNLQEVEFVLRFVRYENVQKPITFTRKDVPQLMDDVRRVRARQIQYHEYAAFEQPERSELLPALAGSHCIYCPAISDNSCPVAKLNPMLNLTPVERLNWRLWHDVANRVNNQTMAQYVDGSGESIHGKDANGKSYTLGPEAKDKVTYPLFAMDEGGNLSVPIVDKLIDWAVEAPEDMQAKRGSKPWMLNLRIGATELKKYLKTKKRELIDNAIKDLATVETKVELRVSRDAEVDDGKGEEHRSFGADSAEEFQF